MGDGPLNIKVEGKPEACRALGTALTGAMANYADTLASAFRDAGNGSQSAWPSSAGDAFRGATGVQATNARKAHDSAAAGGRLLTQLADDLDTVKARMHQAADVATAAGLKVSGDAIQPPDPAPGPGPGPMPAGPPSPAMVQQHEQATSAHNAAVAAHEKQVKAWNEVHATVSEARGLEHTAQERTIKGAHEKGLDLSSLKAPGEKMLTTTISAVGGTSSKVADLLKSAQANKLYADLSTQALEHPGMDTAAFQTMKASAFGTAVDKGIQSKELERIISKVPGPVCKGLSTTISDLVSKATGFEKDVEPFLRKGIPVLRKLPVAGTLVSGALTYDEIRHGADPTKSVEKAAAGTAAGVAGGMLATAALTAVVPGPGWVLAGGMVIGAGLSMATDYVVDHYGDQINHAAEDGAKWAGHQVADGARNIAKVGESVGDGAKKVWDSIF